MITTDDLKAADDFLNQWEKSSLSEQKQIKLKSATVLALAETGNLKSAHRSASLDEEIVGEISGQFVKLSQIKKTESVEDAISGVLKKDSCYPIFSGIHYNVIDQRIEATNKIIAVAVPSYLTGENRVIAQMRSRFYAPGDEIKGSFPNFNNIIPTDYSIFRDFDLEDARRKTAVSIKLNKAFPSSAGMRYDGMLIDPAQFNIGLTCLLRLGCSSMQIGKNGHIVYLKGINNLAMCCIAALSGDSVKVIAEIK